MGASPIVPKPLITGLTSVWPWSIPINETQHKNVKKGIFIVVFFAYILVKVIKNKQIPS